MAEFTVISEVHHTRSTIKELFEFLTDFKNFESILPADKIENFECTDETCSFNIRGVTTLKVKLIEKTPYTSIKFQSEGLAKFDFVLEAKFWGEAEQTGECNIELYATMAPFIKILAEKPLGKLINTMALQLSQMEIGKK